VRGTIHRGAELKANNQLECDVLVIGSGPGGSLAAAKLAEIGASVIVLEEGGQFTAPDFDMHEESAYPRMYQDNGSRTTDDLSIMILQGRCIGGGSTVNWMTSLRAPDTTLKHWKNRHGVEGIDSSALRPHWDEVEARLHIHVAAPEDVNRNNAVLWDGATRLGYQVTRLPRNSDRCDNLGYCGMGCPIDAKRTAGLTYLDDAMKAGTEIYANCRVTRLDTSGGRATGAQAQVLDPDTHQPTGNTLQVKAGRVVLAAGALNTPRILLRSGVEHKALGRRTWLHPVVATVGVFRDRIDPWYGSPQSVGSLHFADRGSRMGFLIEAPPMHPMLAALASPGFGLAHREIMSMLPYTNSLIGLTIDGFDESENGGTVRTGAGGRLRFSYPLRERNHEAMKEAMKAMARIQLAAGATRVLTLHDDPVEIRSESDLGKIDARSMAPGRLSVFTAHQMGGCSMSEDPARSIVNSRGRMHQLSNVYVCDGSVFPTGLGVNPMLSIYGLSSFFSQHIQSSS